ncbi:MAG TPA: hypothetical protein VHX37_11310 [Acidobacteriaceae bacterium]|jgi:hypothetical protein|nr:hypothetical protein [Acidobacteriaceae bacterium]
MDYYQGVVVDYLRADRAVFVNTECCIQLERGANPDTSGPHWYCDAVAIDLRGAPNDGKPTVFLCEISYAEKLAALLDRLKQWSEHWDKVQEALKRDCNVPGEWPVRPWLFVPQGSIARLVGKLELMKGPNGLAVFNPRITPLECVQPWNYHSWQHRDSDTDKSRSGIPEEMWS